MPDPTLLLTRPKPQSEAFLNDVAQVLRRVPVHVISPLFRIERLALKQDVADAQALLFTSTNGVSAFAAQCPDRTAQAICVGPSTFAAARSQGFAASNADGAAGDVLDLALRSLSPDEGPVYHVSGRESAVDLALPLQQAGFQAHRIVLYDQVAQNLSSDAIAALTHGPVVMPVFSPATATALSVQMPDPRSSHIRCICMSEATAKPLRTRALDIEIVPNPNRAAMLAAVLAAL